MHVINAITYTEQVAYPYKIVCYLILIIMKYFFKKNKIMISFKNIVLIKINKEYVNRE